MGIEFVNRVIVLTILLALAAMIAVGTGYGLEAGLGVFAGAAWGTVNLFLIKRLLESLLAQEAKSYFTVAALFGIKFPILYVIGYLLFKIPYFPTLSLLLGFSLFFFVILLKGVGAWMFEKKKPVVTSEDRK